MSTLLAVAILLAPALAVGVWRWTEHDTVVLRARRRQVRRSARRRAREADAAAHAAHRGVAP